MKKLSFSLAGLVIFLLMINGCDKESSSAGISGKITGHSDCKFSRSSGISYELADTLSCVYYLYNEISGELNIIHVNSGFNCCPGELSCEITISQDTILIREYEKEQACDCNCLYDLYITVKGVYMGNYVILFNEPYAYGMEELIFPINLAENISGSYCVARKNYPWGI
ncbi:MAG TPA: hypothetical protein PLR01_05530 [Bacteroidales bacterium]|nr:hypothetical protein [Bacteroidales bacterium]HPM92888.1 hypothetical protein [Bacteroidales bacterium]